MTSVAPSSMPLSSRPWIFSNCASETTGPTRVPSASGAPTGTSSVTRRAISIASSMRAAGTSMRVPASHDWPEFTYIAATSRVITASRSASSSTMLADLPPSSCATRLTVGAALRATSMPARVDPVNDTIWTSGCAESAAPTVGPSPWTRLKTPAGTPASARISATMTALSGAISDGLRTIVQPAASAGATLAPIWFSGQFHGVMRAHTPIGSETTVDVPTCSSNSKPFSVSSAMAKCPSPAGTCAAAASPAGAPISMLTAAARSAARAM